MSDSFSKNVENPIVLIGTYTEPENSNSQGLYVYQIDSASGQLTLQRVIEGLPNVSFMATHPTNCLIYAVSETESFDGQPGGGVNVLSLDDYTVIGRGSSGGAHPCYISIEQTGRFALVANYKSGTISMIPIREDGLLSTPSDVVQHMGSSIHPERQSSPHPHCVIPDPTNCFAIAADLGIDRLIIYKMDLEKGLLHEHAEVSIEAGAGPRHLIFHSEGRFAYLLNELNSTLVVYHYDSENGSFTRLQTVTTLPSDFSGENYPSDLRLAPDEKYLYVANRGQDNIVCFKVDAGSGELSYQSQVPANGSYPRLLALDASGRFMVAVHQRSNNAVVFGIDPDTGELSQTGSEVHLDMPAHVLFV